jgi:hypothetical protein
MSEAIGNGVIWIGCFLVTCCVVLVIFSVVAARGSAAARLIGHIIGGTFHVINNSLPGEKYDTSFCGSLFSDDNCTWSRKERVYGGEEK